MKTVIRIEHSVSGLGMFLHGVRTPGEEYKLYNLVPKAYDRHDDMPNRSNDFPNHARNRQTSLDDYYCAYNSMEQFEQWVTRDEVKTLIDNKFNVVMIDLDKVVEGTMQSFYKLGWVLKKKNINSLFTN